MKSKRTLSLVIIITSRIPESPYWWLLLEGHCLHAIS